MSDESPDAPLADPNHLLIVGAGSGLGAAVARRFGSEGFRITLAARHRQAVDELAGAVHAETGARVDALELDAARPVALRERLFSAFHEHGAPGIVVYSGARMGLDDLLTVAVDDLEEAYAVNVLGAIMTAQAVAPFMRAAGRGTIIFTGGGMADRLPPNIATLGLGKLTLRAAGTILHEQLRPKGIRVTTTTIAGAIEAGGPLDPDKIAEFYWDVCSSPAADWPAEHRFESRVEAGRTTS